MAPSAHHDETPSAHYDETCYDTRARQLPAAAMTGGSVANFDRKQAFFQQDIGCVDADTFARAIQPVAPAGNLPTRRSFCCAGRCEGQQEGECESKCKEQDGKCVDGGEWQDGKCVGVGHEQDGKCAVGYNEQQGSDCASHLRVLMEASEATVEAAIRLRALGRVADSLVGCMLFPARQLCGGCSRSPAWDCLERPSQWLTGAVPAATTNLGRLLSVDVETPLLLALVDTWERKPVGRLQGTVSHAADSFAWGLTASEVQCSDGTFGASELVAESHEGVKGTYRYQGSAPMLGCAQDALAHQLFAVGSLRNARVLNAIMCTVELYHIAAKLLDMRDETLASGLDRHVGGLVTSTERAVFPKVELRGPLPPKLSGYATCPTDAYRELIDREGVRGGMRNTSVFAMSLGYDRTVYGGSLSGLWAIMDTGFMFDYSTASCSADLGHKIHETFCRVRGHDTGDAALNAHILDVVTIISCSYSALKAKAALEDGRKVRSKPCIVMWDDLAAMARYKLADALFCHVFYDSPGDEASLAVVGLGAAIHDLIDVGPDVACGEISNIIPTLAGGQLSFDRLQSVYIGLIATLEWFVVHDAFNPAALAILMTHWWQLCNLRHRPVALMSRVAPSPDYAVCPDKLDRPPSLQTMTHRHGLAHRSGQAVLDQQRAEMDAMEASGLPEIQRLIQVLVRPVLDYADGRETHLPIEAVFCAPVLEACISRQHSDKIRMLWRLLLVMWKSGAMWTAVLASTQYCHQGLTNADRGRDDFNNSTWM